MSNNLPNSALRSMVLAQKVNNEAMYADKGYNKAHHEAHDFARAIKGSKGQEANPSMGNWEEFYPRNLAKLTMIIIAFIFSQDDGEIDKKESKAISKILKKFKPVLTKEDYDEIVKAIDSNPNISFVSNYMRDMGTREGMFREAFGIINNNVKVNDEYRTLLKQLKESFEGMI